MHWNDIGNGLFELIGAFFTWRNYIQLCRERQIKGVYWPTTAFFTAWGIWNLLYYPSLSQWFSFAAGIMLVLGNLSWVVLALEIHHEELKRELRELDRQLEEMPDGDDPSA